MSRDVAIACRDVSRVYRSPAGSVEALDAVTAAFPAGAISALVGPSGSGKSTLLRLVARLDAADGGTIDAGGVEITALGGTALRRYRREIVTYLAQRAAANLVPHLTVREQLRGVALAEELGLGSRLEAHAGELSGGEQARAALAVGLSRETPVLLVDEPTAELDRAAAAHVVDALQRLAAAGRTVVVATHDPDLVGVAATRVELGVPHDARPAAHVPRRGGDPAMKLAGLAKRYGASRVVDGVSLELRGGELGVLVGRSGSGKSTVLMIAGGWLAPDEGVAGVPGSGRPPRWRDTSYLAQRFGLLPELSVAENVALPLRLARAGGDVHPMLERLGLSTLADRLPAETSIGQQQRTALARALAGRPVLLLADEPTSHQDAASAELVWSALADACDAGTACLVATHDESAVARADRLWRIANGRIEA